MISQKWTEHLKNLSQYRDGLIILVTALYVVGYFALAVFSLFHNLGPLPAIDAQYFVAGLPVLVVLFFMIFVVRGMHKFYEETWPNWVNQRNYMTRWLLNVIGIAIIYQSTKYFWHSLNLSAPKSPHNAILLNLILVGWIFGGTFIQRPSKILHKPDDALFTLKMYLIMFSIYGILIYITSIYPQLPQSIGGGKPR